LLGAADRADQGDTRRACEGPVGVKGGGVVVVAGDTITSAPVRASAIKVRTTSFWAGADGAALS
jgi:hypothetical protein